MKKIKTCIFAMMLAVSLFGLTACGSNKDQGNNPTGSTLISGRDKRRFHQRHCEHGGKQFCRHRQLKKQQFHEKRQFR